MNVCSCGEGEWWSHRKYLRKHSLRLRLFKTPVKANHSGMEDGSKTEVAASLSLKSHASYLPAERIRHTKNNVSYLSTNLVSADLLANVSCTNSRFLFDFFFFFYCIQSLPVESKLENWQKEGQTARKGFHMRFHFTATGVGNYSSKHQNHHLARNSKWSATYKGKWRYTHGMHFEIYAPARHRFIRFLQGSPLPIQESIPPKL